MKFFVEETGDADVLLFVVVVKHMLERGPLAGHSGIKMAAEREREIFTDVTESFWVVIRSV